MQGGGGKIKIQVFQILIWFIQNRSKQQPTSRQVENQKKTPQTQNPNQKAGKNHFFSALAQSCAPLNLVVFCSSNTVDTVSNQDGCHYGTHEIYC